MNLRWTKLCVASVLAFGCVISQCMPASAAALDSSAFNNKYEGGLVVNGYTNVGINPVTSTNVNGNDIADYNFSGNGQYQSTFWDTEVRGGVGPFPSHAFTIEWRQTVLTQGTLGFVVYAPDSTGGSQFVAAGSGDFGVVSSPPANTQNNYPDFHVFRIAKDTASGVTQMWRDNIALPSGTNFANDGVNPMGWGGGSGAWASSGKLDYFRVDTTGAYEPTEIRTPAVINSAYSAAPPALNPGSLIELGTVASQSPLATTNTGQGIPYGGANDGLLIPALNSTDNTVLFSNTNAVTYNLDLCTHPQGYDLDRFVATSGFSDATRIAQGYTLLYAKYDDLNTFYPITSFATPAVAANNYLQTTVSNLGATNVGAIQFRVDSAPGGNATVFQELQLFDNSPAIAPPTITFTPSASAPTLATGSLIELGTVGSQSPSAASLDAFGEPVGEATDGILGAPNTVANSATFVHGANGVGTDLIYNLDLSSHPQGYDLDKFIAITGFVDHSRVAQDYTLSYAKVGALTDFIGLATVSSGAAPEDWLESVVDNLHAKNAGAIKIHISAAFGNAVIWQEFQLFEAIPVPEPSSGALLALAGIGLVLRRRSRSA